jgi:hypothetical protein
MRPSRSGGSVPFGATSSVVAPILSVDLSGNLLWAWSGADPEQWVIVESSSGFPDGIQEFIDGANRTSLGIPVSGENVFVVGTNMAGDTETTPESNTVDVP